MYKGIYTFNETLNIWNEWRFAHTNLNTVPYEILILPSNLWYLTTWFYLFSHVTWYEHFSCKESLFWTITTKEIQGAILTQRSITRGDPQGAILTPRSITRGDPLGLTPISRLRNNKKPVLHAVSSPTLFDIFSKFQNKTTSSCLFKSWEGNFDHFSLLLVHTVMDVQGTCV